MTLADELFKQIQQWPQVEAIALGGSRATGAYDEQSDYDVYLYCTEPVPQDLRRDVLSQYCSTMEIGNHYWENEDNCTFNDGIDVDILYRNLDDFAQDVASVVETCAPRNGYTTCMWHNLRTCTILFDPNGRLTQIKTRFDVDYPQALQRAIITRNMALLHGALPSYDAQIHKAASRNDLVSVNHRVAAFLESYFDVIFALNKQTHPGEKRQVAIAKQQCATLPKDFEKNLQNLFMNMFQDPADLDAALALLYAELNKVVQEADISKLEL